MAPNSAVVAGLLRQAVHYHLDNGAWDSALFFAERLAAHDARSHESAYLLALCHARLGDDRSAYEASKPAGGRGLHLGCAFVFAQSCLALERFRDGALALEKAAKSLWLHPCSLGLHSATTRAAGPDAAAVSCLLGKLYRGMDDRKKAAACFEDALRANPLMWDAFTALCDMGLNVRVANTFRASEALLRGFAPDAAPDAAPGGCRSEQQPPQLPWKRAPPAGAPSAAVLAARQPAAHEMSDPFDHPPPPAPPPHPAQRLGTAQQGAGTGAGAGAGTGTGPGTATGAAAGANESEENDFMARIFAARSRVAASGGSGGGGGLGSGQPSPDTMATPPGMPQEPPHAPARRRGGAALSSAAVADSGLPDAPNQQPPPQQVAAAPGVPGAPSKIMYRLGATTRRGRAADSAASGDAAAAVAAAATTASAPQPAAPAAAATSTTERKRTASGHPVAPRQGAAQQDEAGVPQRRSARLNMFNKASAGRANAGAAAMGAATRELKKARPPVSRILRPGSSGSTVGRVVSGNRKPVDDGNMDVDPMEAPRVREPVAPAPAPASAAAAAPPAQAPAPAAAAAAKPSGDVDLVRIEEALRWILELLKKLGGGYLALAQFQCSEVLQILNALPRAQADTPWVQALLGRAQYELAAYAEAEVCFRRVRVLAPTRLADMEVYSTILWFLKRETELSFLAHELVDAAWQAPQAWCALGNAWSLAQDHEQALRCFRRATQLRPGFAYAYTLQGHEHVLNEEYDKALTAYRHAVAADRRHYNAYYGIGRVYEKLGNLDKAYAHYRTASAIHPTNAVLVCCLGQVLERQKQILPALQLFSQATDLAPRAAQTRFRKARALLATGQLQAAQQELMILKNLAPDEAAVHFLLGKLYKTLNDKSAAVRHFTIALSLDPKASQKIKQAIGSLEDDDDGLEEYMVA